MLEVLQENGTTILKSDNILFVGGNAVSFNEDLFDYFKLYLLKKRDKFIVLSPTKYISDDDFTSFLSAYDLISHPISLNIYREFNDEGSAQRFYGKILSSSPKPFDYKSLFGSEDHSYGYDYRKSVHYDPLKRGKIRHDEFYQKELVRHGYQRIMLRMFRLGNRLVINKRLSPEFKTEESCKLAFEKLKNHFDTFDLNIIPYRGDENKLNQMLEQIMAISLDSDSLKVEVKRDNLKRFTELNLSFSINDSYISVDYSLPTRNGNYHGSELKGTISHSLSGNRFFQTYDYEKRFMADLQKVIELII